MWITLSTLDNRFVFLGNNNHLLVNSDISSESRELETINISSPQSRLLHFNDEFIIRTGNGKFVRVQEDGTLLADVSLSEYLSHEPDTFSDRLPAKFRLIIYPQSRRPDGTWPDGSEPGTQIGLEYIKLIPPDNTLNDWLSAFIRSAFLLTNFSPAGFHLGEQADFLAQLLAGPPGSRIEHHHIIANTGNSLEVAPDRVQRAGNLFYIFPIQHKIHLALPGAGVVTIDDGESNLYAANNNRGSSETFNLIVKSHGRRPSVESIRHGDQIQIQGNEGKWLWGTRGGSGPVAASFPQIANSSPPPLFIERTTRLAKSSDLIEHGDRIRLRTGSGWYLRAHQANNYQIFADADQQDQASIFVVEKRRKLSLFRDNNGDSFSLSSHNSISEAHEESYDLVRDQCMISIGPSQGLRPLCLFHHADLNDHVLVSTDTSIRALEVAGYDFIRIEGFVEIDPQPGTVQLRIYESATPNDHSTVCQIADEQWCETNGYRFLRAEGNVYEIADQSVQITPIDLSDLLRVDEQVLLDVGESASIREHLGTNVGQIRIGSHRRWVQGGPPVLRISDPQIRDDLRDDLQNGRVSGHGAVDLPVPLAIPIPNKTRTIEHALVLSGGGAKGAFEVGAALKLWDDGYRPDLICGVSVGALNGSVLAEKPEPGESPPQRLERIWRSLGDRPAQRVFESNFYLDRLGQIGGDALKKLAGKTIGNLHLGQISAIAGDIEGLSNEAVNLLKTLHAVHSMRPLRELIQRELRPQALRDSATGLRLGITDARTGRYFSVASADPGWPDDMAHLGRVEVEPDHGVGDDWLTRPLYGSDQYLMRLEQAVYGSSIMPAFMEPLLARLQNSNVRKHRGEQFTELHFILPPIVEQLLNGITSNFSFDMQDSGPESNSRYIFDGGLRDTMPIRTAMRLGARHITVISGDVLSSAPWSPNTLLPSELQPPPGFDNLTRLLSIWSNDVARNDLMLAVGYNELLGSLYKIYSDLDETARVNIGNELDRYWRMQGQQLRWALGGSTSIGGVHSPRAVREFGIGAHHYGTPLHDEGCRITLINPDRNILDALGFHDRRGIHDAIELGYERAYDPVQLSFPVPSEEIRNI